MCEDAPGTHRAGEHGETIPEALALRTAPAGFHSTAFLTLEISNTTPLPARIYGGEGIAQLLFSEGDEPPNMAYADRRGSTRSRWG